MRQILVIAILAVFTGLSFGQVTRALDSNGNPQFVSPTNPMPVTNSTGATSANPIFSSGVPQAVPVPDSMISAQTKTYQFNGALMAMVTIYNPSVTTPDTVSQALWNYAKNSYSTNAIALISLNTIDDGQVESDPTTVIIPPLTSRKWLIDGYNIWGYQIVWKNTAGKTSANKFYISYSFVR